jgi:hypothetical protein
MEFSKWYRDLISLSLNFNDREDFFTVPFRSPRYTTPTLGDNKTFTIAWDGDLDRSGGGGGAGDRIVVLMNRNFIRKSSCWKIRQ